MMILQRYIIKNILSSTLLVLLVLLGFTTFLEFFGELDDLGKGHYQLGDIALYISLTTPSRIYQLLPIAALLGSLLGLGNLASQSELVAMRTAGLSVVQISKAVMIVAVSLMVVALFIGEVIRPIAEQKAQEVRSVAQTGTVSMRSEYGFWTRDGYYFNHIEHILSDGHFSGVTIYEFNSHNQLRTVTKAREALYNKGRWLLSEVVQSTINDQNVQVSSVAHVHWKSQLNPGMIHLVAISPEFMHLWNLLKYITYLKANHQAVEQYQIAFWTKIMMPISSIVMVFLAVPFSFGPLRSTSVGSRVFVGAFIGLGFHLLNNSFQSIGLVFGLLPWLTAATPTIVFAVLGIYLMKKVR